MLNVVVFRRLAVAVLTVGIFVFFAASSVSNWDAYIELNVASEKPFLARMNIDTEIGSIVKPAVFSNPRPLPRDKRHTLSIRNNEQKSNRAEEYKYVAILKLILDGKEYKPEIFHGRKNTHFYREYLLVHPQAKVSYTNKFKRATIRMGMPRTAGKTEILVDNEPYITLDFHSSLPGQTLDVEIGRHIKSARTQSLRLPKANLKKVSINFDQLVDYSLLSAKLVVHDANRNAEPGLYKKNSIYSIDLNETVFNRETGELILPEILLKKNQRQHHYLVVASLCLSLVLGLILFEMFELNWLGLRKKIDVKSVAIVSVIAGVVTCFSFLCSPAIMQTDSMSVWLQVKNLDFNTWHSHMYPWFILCLTLLHDSPVVLTVFQSVLTIALLSLIYLYMYYRRVNVFVLLALLVLNLSCLPVLIYPAFMVRDVLYALLSVIVFTIFGVILLEKARGKVRNIKGRYCIYLGVVTAFLYLLRAEGVYLLVCVPAFFYWVLRREIKKTLYIIVSICVMVAVFGAPLKAYLNAGENKYYQLTLAIEPLGQMVQGDYNSDDYERDKKIINKVIDFQDLVDHYKYLGAFWSGKHLHYGRFNDEDIENFVWLTKHLAMRNPSKFLKNRVRVFADAIGSRSGDLNNIASLLHDSGSRWGWHEFEQDKYNAGIYDALNTSRSMYKSQLVLSKLIDATLKSNSGVGFDVKFYMWTMWIPFGVLVLVVLLFPLIPVSALVSSFIVGRVSLLFLFQPMGHFKYFFDLYLWGFVVFGLVLVEVRTPHLIQAARERVSRCCFLFRRFRMSKNESSMARGDFSHPAPTVPPINNRIDEGL